MEAVLFGAYKLLQGDGAYGEQYILVPDLIADAEQIKFIGTFTDYSDITRKIQDKTNGLAAGIWATGYTTINVANTVLDKISVVNADERDAIIGEAKFIRGMVYFQLANIYGLPYSAGNTSSNLAVPLMLSPVYAYDSTKDKPARATIDEVYNQVIADLKDAVAKLPESADNGRATKYSAEAFLARVYMNMADYADAAAAADDVINSGLYALTPSFGAEFNNTSNSSEDIFAIQETSQSNAGTTNGGISTFYQALPSGRGDVQTDPKYFNHFDDANDDRAAFFYSGTSIAGFDGTYTFKWVEFYKAIPVVRLAEMYLTRGEANLHLGTPVGGSTSAQDYNTVRARSNAASKASVRVNDFVEERLRELGFEGDRMFTLKRLKMNVDNLPYTDGRLILPIPQAEIDVNGNLAQNPGY